jgi:hypothetical protein
LPTFQIPEKFKDRIVLVSSGIRSDPSFIRRLKSFIMMADAALCNDVGTQIGYCLHLNTPVMIWKQMMREDIEILHEGAPPFLKKVRDDFAEAFPYDRIEITEKQIDLCEPYWGFAETKTPEEMKTIIGIAVALLKRSRGFAGRYVAETKRLLSETKSGDTKQDRQIHQLLSEAIQ